MTEAAEDQPESEQAGDAGAPSDSPGASAAAPLSPRATQALGSGGATKKCASCGRLQPAKRTRCVMCSAALPELDGSAPAPPGAAPVSPEDAALLAAVEAAAVAAAAEGKLSDTRTEPTVEPDTRALDPPTPMELSSSSSAEPSELTLEALLRAVAASSHPIPGLESRDPTPAPVAKPEEPAARIVEEKKAPDEAPTDVKPAEAKLPEPKPAEAKLPEAKLPEPKPAEAKLPEPKLAEPKPAEAKLPEPKPADAKPAAPKHAPEKHAPEKHADEKHEKKPAPEEREKRFEEKRPSSEEKRVEERRLEEKRPAPKPAVAAAPTPAKRPAAAPGPNAPAGPRPASGSSPGMVAVGASAKDREALKHEIVEGVRETVKETAKKVLDPVARGVDGTLRGLEASNANLVKIVKAVEALAQDAQKRRKDYDVLHGEMRDYKANFIDVSQRPLYMDLLLLFDSMERVERNFDGPAETVSKADAKKAIGEVKDQLLEVLYRRDLEPITERPERLDVTFQKPVRRIEVTDPAEDRKVVGVIREGFRRGKLVFRPQEVVVQRCVTTPSDEAPIPDTEATPASDSEAPAAAPPDEPKVAPNSPPARAEAEAAGKTSSPPPPAPAEGGGA